MITKITIRKLQKGDVGALLSFANMLIKEDTYMMLSGDLMTIKEERQYVDRSILQCNKKEKVHVVAVKGDKIIGSAEIRRGTKRKHHMGEIGLAVLEGYRREGVGRELMQSLIKEGKSLGLRMLMLRVFANNLPAISFYKKFGFIECGTLPDAFFWRGKYVGEVTFFKML